MNYKINQKRLIALVIVKIDNFIVILRLRMSLK